MKGETQSLSRRPKYHDRRAVAGRVEKELEALNNSRLALVPPEGVVPLNKGFFLLQEIRARKAAKVRTSVVAKKRKP